MRALVGRALWRFPAVKELRVERMDLEAAARWLDSFPADAAAPGAQMSSDILRVAFGLEQPKRGVALLDAYGWDWVSALAERHEDTTDEAVALLVWCLWHMNDLDQARRIAALLRLVKRLRAGREEPEVSPA